MKFRKRNIVIAALALVALIGTGVTASTLSAQASVPGDAWAMPAIGATEMAVMRETVTVDGTPTFEERFNQETGSQGTPNGSYTLTTVDPALSTSPVLHSGSTVEIDYLTEVNLADFAAGPYFQPTGIEWNPSIRPDSWLTSQVTAPTCTDLSTTISNDNSGTDVATFDCSATFTMPSSLIDGSTNSFPALAMTLKTTPTLSNADATSGNLTAPITTAGFGGYSNYTYNGTSVVSPPVTPPVDPPVTPITITPAPVNIEVNAGDPVAVQTGDLTTGATYSDGSTGTPDIATIVTQPTGATSDPNDLFDFESDTPGTFPFTYSLADDTTDPEATSAVVTGTITVDPIDQIIGVPQTFNLVVGDHVTFTSDELAVGATNSLDGTPALDTIVDFSPPIPAGGTVNELDNGESMDFDATTPGTYQFSYVLGFISKDTYLPSDVITSTIVVTAVPVTPVVPPVTPPAVHLPTVTG
jgi:hypothetical protein